MSARPLTEREAETLSFLLDAPGVPDRDALRRQASVATVTKTCSCGCATISLTIDRVAAPQASRDLPYALVGADTPGIDLREIDRVFPQQVYGKDGTVLSRRVARRDKGALGLILFVSDGWLSSLELTYVGDVAPPPEFPPLTIFEAPRVMSLGTEVPFDPDENPPTFRELFRLMLAFARLRLRRRVGL